ncbi:helix-turn-helix transcriptional regulator [Arthrobacter sp. KN11-1C]|uniref:helix-turn-helix transcriptional regulator n=1 Tax=Arthrobacter sp. KN11-1C TaxID=3445774 RepID=UPI003F9FA4F9
MTTSPGQTFARRLREERIRAGLSQAALAERLSELLDQKVDTSAVTRIEKHERAVRLDEAVVIAELLDLPLPAMLRDSETVDEQVAELQRDLSLEQWRASQAEAELQQAQESMAAIRRLIAELEESRPQ